MNPHMGAGSIRRVEVVEVDDSGEIQKVTVRGLADEYFDLPLRAQPAGLTGNPVKGAIGHVLLSDGNPDTAHILNLENPKKRPKGLKPGESQVYADAGQKLHFDDAGNGTLQVPGDLTIACGGTLHINQTQS